MTKQEIELFETGNGIILTFWSDGHFPVDDFKLWNFVNNSFLAIDIVEIGLRGKKGNRLVYIGNGIILIV